MAQQWPYKFAAVRGRLRLRRQTNLPRSEREIDGALSLSR
jgi:hypothetical protein